MVGGIHRRPVLLNRKRKVGFASLHSSTVVDDIVDGREETQGFSSSSTRSIDTRKEEIKKLPKWKNSLLHLLVLLPCSFLFVFLYRILNQEGGKAANVILEAAPRECRGGFFFFLSSLVSLLFLWLLISIPAEYKKKNKMIIRLTTEEETSRPSRCWWSACCVIRQSGHRSASLFVCVFLFPSYIIDRAISIYIYLVRRVQ